MVESIGPQDAADRDLEEHYRTLEEAYAAQHWSHVIHLGENLLGSLKGTKGLAFELRPRTQVLIAHAYLYGLNDRDAAEDLYGAVISSRCDPALRHIAAEGLKACNLPLQGRGGVKDRETTARGTEAHTSLALEAPLSEPESAPDVPAPEPPAETAGGVAPAMPWVMQAPTFQPPGATPAGGSSPGDAPWLSRRSEPPSASEKLIPEVVEEPEQIEVHQADPALADRVDLTITAPDPQLPPAPDLHDSALDDSALDDSALDLDQPLTTRPPTGPASPPRSQELSESQAVAGLAAAAGLPAMAELQEVAKPGGTAVADSLEVDGSPRQGETGRDPSWPDPLDLDGLPSLGNPIDDPDADLASGLLRVVIR